MDRRRGSNVTMETEMGVVWLQAKECQQLPEAGRVEEQIVPYSPQKKCGLPNTLISAQRSGF